MKTNRIVLLLALVFFSFPAVVSAKGKAKKEGLEKSKKIKKGHGHDHAGHDHGKKVKKGKHGHDHGSHEGHDHGKKAKKVKKGHAHDHAGHDHGKKTGHPGDKKGHAGHNHKGHNHGHAGHNHGSHAGHNHAKRRGFWKRGSGHRYGKPNAGQRYAYALQGENSKHEKRLAKIMRIREIAKDKKKTELLAKTEIMFSKETQRHELALKRIHLKSDAFKNGKIKPLKKTKKTMPKPGSSKRN